MLKLIPPPDGVLSISRSDLPEWAQSQVVTASAWIASVGPPDTVMEGDQRVPVDGAPVARVGDPTLHGGHIVDGTDRILVNGIPAAYVSGFASCPMNNGTVPHIGGLIVTPGNGDDYLALIDPVFEEALLSVSAVEEFEAYLDRWGADGLPQALRELEASLETRAHAR